MNTALQAATGKISPPPWLRAGIKQDAHQASVRSYPAKSHLQGTIMMQTSTLPPFVQANDKVILFDGVCKLCNGWSRFIIRHDKTRVFKLASVQSPQGQAILQHFGLPLDQFETMLFVNGSIAYQKSTAFLQIIQYLPTPFSWLRALRFFPLFFRDWLYDRIALNRYRLFGRYQQCLLPTPDHAQRFL